MEIQIKKNSEKGYVWTWTEEEAEFIEWVKDDGDVVDAERFSPSVGSVWSAVDEALDIACANGYLPAVKKLVLAGGKIDKSRLASAAKFSNKSGWQNFFIEVEKLSK